MKRGGPFQKTGMADFQITIRILPVFVPGVAIVEVDAFFFIFGLDPYALGFDMNESLRKRQRKKIVPRIHRHMRVRPLFKALDCIFWNIQKTHVNSPGKEWRRICPPLFNHSPEQLFLQIKQQIRTISFFIFYVYCIIKR